MGTKIADLELSARLLVIEKGAFGSCTALRTLIFPQVPSLYLPCTFPVPSLYLPCGPSSSRRASR
jgi:hypothetical protein